MPTRIVKSEVLDDSNYDKAIEWIIANQNNDGSWNKIKEVSFLDTSEVVKYLKENNITNGNIEKSQKFIENLKNTNFDIMARKLTLITNEEKKLEIINQLIKSQNEDGGWGLTSGYLSNPLDTVIIIDAIMSEKNINQEIISKAIDYLLKTQRVSGAWGYNDSSEDSILLTAQIVLCINKFISNNKLVNSDIYSNLMMARDFLVSKREQISILVTEREDVIQGIMLCRALIVTGGIDSSSDVDRLLIDLQETNGSWFESPYITVNALMALQDIKEIKNGSINEIRLFKEENGVEVESYNFNAYENIKIEVGSKFDINTYSILAFIKTPNGKIVNINSDGNLSWNTRNSVPGEYSVIVQIKEKTKGRVIASKEIPFNINQTFGIGSISISKDPKQTNIGDNVEVKADVTIVNESNIDKEVDVTLKVLDGDSSVVLETQKVNLNLLDNLIVIDPISFIPDVSCEKIYIIRAEVYDGEEIICIGEDTFEVKPPQQQARIDINQSINKEILMPDTDSLDLAFNLTGEGVVEEIERKAVDLVLCVDNSGSMEWGNEDESTDKPWRIDFAKEASKHIIDLLSNNDRGAVVEFAGNVWVQQELTDDKQLIKDKIDSTPASPWNGTAIGAALKKSISVLDKLTTVEREQVIILLSDGGENVWSNASTINQAKIAKQKGYKVYTIGLGSGVDENLLMNIANESNGEYTYSPTMEELDDMMKELASQIFDVSGRNVLLETTIPSNNAIINLQEILSEPISNIENIDGSRTLKWNYNHVFMGENKSIQLKYQFNNLIRDTSVYLTKDTKLTYLDINNKEVSINLDDLLIPVNKDTINTNINLDKNKFGVDEDIKISIMSENITAEKMNLVGKTEIYDINNNLVDTVKSNIVYSLEANEIKTISNTWNTSNTLAGIYKARITWYDENKIISFAEKEFEIVSDVRLKSNIILEKQSYNVDENVNFTVAIENMSSNYIVRNINVISRIQNEEGIDIWNKTDEFKDIYQNSKEKKSYTFNTGKNLPGKYSIIIEVYDGLNLIDKISKDFTIISSIDKLIELDSEFEVITKEVYPNNDINFSYSVINEGNSDIKNITLQAKIIDISTSKIIGSVGDIKDIDISESILEVLTWKHESLNIGKYLVVFEAVQLDGTIIPLRSGYFEVLESQNINKSKVEKPIASIESSIVNKGEKIKLSSTTEGAEIYYTIDGSMPTRSSILYKEEITLEKDCTIKAIAIKDGMDDSDIAEFNYSIKIEKEKVNKPIASIESGIVNKGEKIKLSSTTEGAEIYYTIDGSIPTRSSILYKEEITLEKDCTIKVIAIKDGMDDSDIAEFNYSIKVEKEKVKKPIASIKSGIVNKGEKVKLSSITEVAEIYYTIDGSMPTRSSILYKEEIRLEKDCTIKAIAIKDDMDDSEVLEVNYMMNSQPVLNSTDITIELGEKYYPIKGITAIDKEDGDITSLITVVENNVDINKVGIYKVTYEVVDLHGLKTTKSIKVTVINKDDKQNNKLPEDNNSSNTNSSNTNSSNNNKLPSTGGVNSLIIISIALMMIIIGRYLKYNRTKINR